MNGVIYIDILYMINFALDAAAFWATSRFMCIRPCLLRLLFASSLGAFSAIILIFLPFARFINLFLIAVLMLLCMYILFPMKNIFFILKASAVYFLILFAMAGAALGGQTVISDISLQNSWKILIFSLAAASLMAIYGMGMIIQKWQRRSFCKNITIQLNGKEVAIDALVDTGNDLCEPISRQPAIIAEISALSALFPQSIFNLIRKNAPNDPAAVISDCHNEIFKKRLRLLPYSSIGGNGILLGFRPDLVIIEGEENIYTDEVIVCFYHGNLASDCGARAIINPAVMSLPNIFTKKKVC